MSKRGSQREKVRVVCRCRPVNPKEVAAGGVTCVRFFPADPGAVEVVLEDSQNNFNFDRMFTQDASQAAVFDDTAAPLIVDVLQGYNATIFAYGQTGTGKTHTMEGDIYDETGKGIIPRSVDALFDGVCEADEHIEFTFKVSYVEIYMEKIRDLLDPHRLKNNLTVREDKVKGIYIAGVTEEYVTSQEELLQIMSNGAQNRATAATGMNEGSSRSHSVFTITVGQKDMSNATTKSGKLVLVDLAGSEMVRKSNASGQQLEEAKTINKSLSALGMVINALTDETATHVPYRDSKLTRILQDSLGGNAKTVLIVAISPSSFNGNETVSTLRFGMRAKNIENKVTVNATRSVDELEALLRRAEEALDAQMRHISSLLHERKVLFARLQERGIDVAELGFGDEVMQHSDELAEAGIAVSGGEAVVSSSPARSQGAYSPGVVQQLQDQISGLQQELEEEKEDTTRREGELAQLSTLLREKERLLAEAGDLLMEARRHYETQRERCEALTKEKAESVSRIERELSASQEKCSAVQYEVKELEVTLDTLQTENKQLRQEIAEMSGDAVTEGPLARPNANNNSDPSAGISVGGGSATPTSPSSSNVAMVPLSSTGTLQSVQERERERNRQLLQLEDLLSTLRVEPKAADAINALVKDIATQAEAVTQKFELRFAALEQAGAEQGKRIRDLEAQRGRLEVDLSNRTEKVVALQLQLDSLSFLDGAKAAELFNERERAHMKSLQLRLEQLVAVHRQLLRKFATLELDCTDMRKKIALRDDRIKQLEGNSRGMSSSMRQQAERHVAELSNLREQIQVMRSEHVQRVEAARLMVEAGIPAGGGQFSPSVRGGPRTVRGGGHVGFVPGQVGSGGRDRSGSGSGSGEKTIRGGYGGSEDASPGSSSFSKTASNLLSKFGFGK